MNKIMTLSNVGYKIDDKNFIKNLNLDFYSGENVLITGKDYIISNLMIDLIIGVVKPQIGNVIAKSFDEKRYFIGYNNFESVLKHGAQVQDIINTLVTSQRYLVNDDDEVNELIGLFSLDKVLNKSTNNLTPDQLFLLNLSMLLIVKPRIIILKQLPLTGSANFQLSALKYIYNYTKKYEISLIMITDNKVIIENLIDRQLKVDNGKIISDVSISVVANYTSNSVDNKTKEFNLENVLINALNAPYTKTINEQNITTNSLDKHPTEHLKNNSTTQIETPNQTKQIEIEIPFRNSETKTIKVEFDEHLEHTPSPRTTPIKTEHLQTQNLKTEVSKNLELSNDDEPKIKNVTKYETKTFNKTKPHTSSFVPLNDQVIKFNTSALEDDDEFISTNNLIIEHETLMVTKRLTEITKEFQEILLQDPTTILDNDSNNHSDLESIDKKIDETMLLKNELDEQVKDPNFCNLSINLQSRILDNLERANEIINNDVKNITNKFPITNSVTKMIINEYDNEPVSDNQYNTSIIDDETKVLNEKTEELIEKEVAVENSDLFYYDNERPNSRYDLWRKKRKVKAQEKHSYESTVNNNDEQSDNIQKNANITEQIDNYTSNLKPEETVIHEEPNEKLITTPFQVRDEPKAFYTDPLESADNDLLDELDNIKINSKTGIFGLEHNNEKMTQETFVIDEVQFESKNMKKTESVQTMQIKQRTKLNTIEKLYKEALEDLSVVDEQRNKK